MIFIITNYRWLSNTISNTIFSENIATEVSQRQAKFLALAALKTGTSQLTISLKG